jgi:hypothetical protein
VGAPGIDISSFAQALQLAAAMREDLPAYFERIHEKPFIERCRGEAVPEHLTQQEREIKRTIVSHEDNDGIFEYAWVICVLIATALLFIDSAVFQALDPVEESAPCYHEARPLPDFFVGDPMDLCSLRADR